MTSKSLRGPRVMVGDFISSWMTAVTNPVFIRGVHCRWLENLHGTIGFNGPTVHATIQF